MKPIPGANIKPGGLMTAGKEADGTVAANALHPANGTPTGWVSHDLTLGYKQSPARTYPVDQLVSHQDETAHGLPQTKRPMFDIPDPSTSITGFNPHSGTEAGYDLD